MKKRFVYIVIIMLSVLASVWGYATSYTVLADVSPVCVLSSNDYRLDNNYLDYYAIDQSHFTILVVLFVAIAVFVTLVLRKQKRR